MKRANSFNGVINICLVSLGVFISSSQLSAQKLFLPKKEDSKPVNYATTIQAIIFSSEKIYCYAGEKIDSGRFYSLLNGNDFRQFIVAGKKKFADSLLVLIKRTSSSGYNSVVDVLDEMSINEIKQYAILNVTSEEKKKLGLDKTIEDIKPEHTKSGSTKTPLHPDENHVDLIFKFDTSKISFYSIESTKELLKGNVPMDETKLKEIVANAQSISSQQNKILTVIIKGNFQSDYHHFKPLLDALQARKIYDFKMITP